MGRKRLLTILAAVTAAVTIQVGPAAAADDCLVLGVDVLKLSQADPEDCVVDALTGKVLKEAEKVTEPVKQTTETVEKATTDTVNKTTETVKKTTQKTSEGGSPAPAPSDPPSTSQPTAPTEGKTSSSGGTTTERRSAAPSDVRTSGDAQQPRTWDDQTREGHLEALRAIRSDLAAGSPLERGMAGPVQPFGGPTSTDLDLAAPEVADSGVVAGVDDGAAPEVAPADQQDAVLATSSPMRDVAEAPLALKLLAAALVLGAGAVWTIASRELGKDTPTTA